MLIIWRPWKLQTTATNTLRCLKRARSHEIASSSRLAKSSGTVLDLESNVLLLRLFQSIQEVRITKESKHIRSALAILLRAIVLQSARSRHWPFGASSCQFSISSVLYQISLAKQQLSSKCVIVSDSWAQSAHESSSCRLCLFRLSAVQQKSNDQSNEEFAFPWRTCFP